MKFFDDIEVGDRMRARHAHLHGRGHQDVRARNTIRSRFTSTRRRRRVAFRRAVRLRLAHGRGVDAAARRVSPARGRRARARAARSFAKLGPSPGFRDLKWLKPVYAGDTITYATEIDRQAGLAKPARLGSDVRAQYRHQPEGRAGDVLHQLRLRRAPAGSRMTRGRSEMPDSTRGATSAAPWGSPAARMRCTTAIPI